jgi:thiol-disulfide isomerase/thioredoxin
MKFLWTMMLVAGVLLAAVGTAAAQDDAKAGAGPRPIAEYQLADFEGQVVLVDFWASWCKPCRYSLPWLNAMQQKYGSAGLQVVMINLDRDSAAAAELAATITPDIVQFQDPAGIAAARHELEGMPSSFVYDRSGALISRHVGFLKSEQEVREEALAVALKRKEP